MRADEPTYPLTLSVLRFTSIYYDGDSYEEQGKVGAHARPPKGWIAELYELRLFQ